MVEDLSVYTQLELERDLVTISFYIPEGYKPQIDLKETQVAIKTVKDFFQRELTKQLNLTRVSAPLFVTPESGLNDNLNAFERRVEFT